MMLQFGAGKFLRAFVDLFMAQANRTAHPAGQAMIVQSTGGGRAAHFNRAAGRYRIAVRGLEAGALVDRIEAVDSVARAITAAEQWPAALAVARSPELRVIVSNTTEAGYQLDAADAAGDAPPRSFPARLLAVLEARHAAGLPGLAILPCELLDRNAQRLRELVLEQARRWGRPTTLCDWAASACVWRNTLVDRIVSAPKPNDPAAQDDPLYAVAEPYAFWGWEGPLDWPGMATHPAVRMVDDLTPYSLRKVRILNGAHTALVAKALPLGFVTVREALADAEIRRWLETLLFEEVVPVLAGRTEDPAGFARDTLERFANPFLDHRLADIALHHETKLQTRLAPTLAEYRERFGRAPRLLAGVMP